MFVGVEFGSCYVYSPQGACPLSQRSRRARKFLKAGDCAFLRRYVRIVSDRVESGCEIARLFDGRPILVPVPGSCKCGHDSPWVAQRLCLALRSHGLGRGVWAGLKRVNAVRKSGTAPRDQRPSTWAHYRSFAVDSPPPEVDRFLLVDDIVTRGRTLLAAATRLQEACPRARIGAFAFVRTMGLIPNVERLVDPCIGEICWRNGDARRAP